MHRHISTVVLFLAACADRAPPLDRIAIDDAARPLYAQGYAPAPDALVDCYRDDDGDGYHATDAAPSRVGVDISGVAADCADKCTCALGAAFVSGYHGDDCDDTTAAVRPRAPEQFWNGVDDNCVDGVDEPTYGGTITLPSEANSYAAFGMWAIFVNDATLRDYLVSHSTVRYTVTYERLATGDVSEVTSAYLTAATTGYSGGLFMLVADSASLGLSRRAVYRVRLQFYDGSNVELGPRTGNFFTMTRGTNDSPNGGLHDARYQMVNAAFTQMVDSDNGRVGYKGTVDVDGTRYTDPSLPTHSTADDVAWCDWFYWWLGNHIATPSALFAGMSPDRIADRFKDPTADGCGTESGDRVDGDGRSNERLLAGSVATNTIDSSCEKYDGAALAPADVTLDADRQYYAREFGTPYYEATLSQPGERAPGDFILFKWHDGGAHVGLFLGYYPEGNGALGGRAGTGGTLYYVAGNEGNKVAVNAISGTSEEIAGYGILLLKNFR